MFAQPAPSHPTDRLAWFDFARGFAMLTIVVYHALQPITATAWNPLIAAGGAGVHVFIFCSGFGLMRSSANASLRAFFQRRFVRILVPYYVFVTAVFLLNQFTHTYPDDGWRAYLSHLLLFKMFDESLIGTFGEHLWFISTIVQLYLLFPLLTACLNRWGAGLTFGFAAIVSAAFSVWLIAAGLTELRVYASSAPVFLWEFVLGMITARTYPQSVELVRRARWATLLLVAAAGSAVHLTARQWLGSSWFGFDDVCALASYGAATLLLYRWANSKPQTMLLALMIGLSQFSYELYLVHGVIITRLFRWQHPQTWAAQCITCLASVALSVVAGWGYHRLLQTVFWRRRDEARGWRSRSSRQF